MEDPKRETLYGLRTDPMTEEAPQDPNSRPSFPVVVMSIYEENTIYLFRDNGQELRVQLGVFRPQQWEILTEEEKKYLRTLTTY